MAQSINMINDLTPINENWKIKVRIIRLWEVSNYNNPNAEDSIKTIMQQFSNMVKEGSCHIIAKFGLISNIGKHRATYHSYKLNFFFKTIVK
ncbi:Replication protein A 70 kDa DNA-binding subunit C, partial [Bienertia sinuspersici]